MKSGWDHGLNLMGIELQLKKIFYYNLTYDQSFPYIYVTSYVNVL
ncbi:hypothetical protein C900_05219 [Fulvivirga imtechensis AK7]|uniref:Uncharacterized protein n=1 Tax=Fulvivirga imtechensis AK7 TaxID=1237149 RepID=L8JWL1_9BACT|nr:hypothetical protein C900_05219 [Fulvivirga imtechensis AK7]